MEGGSSLLQRLFAERMNQAPVNSLDESVTQTQEPPRTIVDYRRTTRPPVRSRLRRNHSNLHRSRRSAYNYTPNAYSDSDSGSDTESNEPSTSSLPQTRVLRSYGTRLRARVAGFAQHPQITGRHIRRVHIQAITYLADATNYNDYLRRLGQLHNSNNRIHRHSVDIFYSSAREARHSFNEIYRTNPEFVNNDRNGTEFFQRIYDETMPTLRNFLRQLRAIH